MCADKQASGFAGRVSPTMNDHPALIPVHSPHQVDPLGPFPPEPIPAEPPPERSHRSHRTHGAAAAGALSARPLHATQSPIHEPSLVAGGHRGVGSAPEPDLGDYLEQEGCQP